MRILYVEDNESNLALVERVAHLGDHEVLNYDTAEATLENFDRINPDLLLVDLYLAGEIDGIDLIHEVRQAGYNTPIVVITAYDSNLHRERCLAAGCDDYFSKPIPVEHLRALMDRYTI